MLITSGDFNDDALLTSQQDRHYHAVVPAAAAAAQCITVARKSGPVAPPTN
jgi:hypothetical protein